MGKYTKMLQQRPLKKFEAEDEEDPKYQDKVNAKKAELIELNGGPIQMERLAEMILIARESRDRVKDDLKKENLTLTAITQLLVDKYEDAKITSLKLSVGKTVANEPEIVAKVKDKEAFRKWAIANGFENEMQIIHQTRTRIAREMFLAGEADPDGIELGLRDKIVVR